MNSSSADDKIKARLIAFFGNDERYDIDRAASMKDVAQKDRSGGIRVDSESIMGLIALYCKSGGKLTPRMSEIVKKVM